MDRNQAVLINALTRRTRKSIAAGGDGYIPTVTLSFDAGLNTRAIRRVLDEMLANGRVARRSNGPGKPYTYRAIED